MCLAMDVLYLNGHLAEMHSLSLEARYQQSHVSYTCHFETCFQPSVCILDRSGTLTHSIPLLSASIHDNRCSCCSQLEVNFDFN